MNDNTSIGFATHWQSLLRACELLSAISTSQHVCFSVQPCTQKIGIADKVAEDCASSSSLWWTLRRRCGTLSSWQHPHVPMTLFALYSLLLPKLTHAHGCTDGQSNISERSANHVIEPVCFGERKGEYSYACADHGTFVLVLPCLRTWRSGSAFVPL